MKGKDFLISEIVEKKNTNKKVMHENLNPLNNILVSYEAYVDFLTLA